MIKDKVKSLADLKEVIRKCFYGEECDTVFALLGKEERNLLTRQIRKKKEFEESLESWEERFLDYQSRYKAKE